MVSVGYGQQLTQLNGGNIQLKQCILLKDIHYKGKKAGGTLPAQHLLDRVLQGQKNTTFFYRDDDFNELRSEGESGFEIADPRFTWWTTCLEDLVK